MPDSGTIRPTFTSAGACACTAVDSPLDNPTAAAPESTVRRESRATDFLSCLMCCPPGFLLFVDAIATCRDTPVLRDRRHARFACRLRARCGRLPAHSHDRPFPTLRRHAEALETADNGY